MGTEMKVGGNKNEYHPLPIEIFIEIKKNIVKSRRKMESLCHILRRNKVTMTKCIREKLKCNDHRLDDCYETVKIKTQMNITEEVQIDPTVKRRGRKTAKLTEKVKKTVEEETDLTILKDVSEFLNNLAEERGIFKEDVVHRISLDGGDNSFKLISNTFSKHQDPDITFTRTEQPGNLCSGVKRSIVLAYAEGIQENYHNLTIICQILKLNELKHVVAADLKLLNILMGLSGHGGKYACIYCEGQIGLEAGKLCTFGSIMQHNQNYVAVGYPINKMLLYKNFPCLILMKTIL